MSESTSAGSPTAELSPERRAELLALAPADALVALAEQCLLDDDLVVIAGPEVGMVMLTVREPIALERFHLGEVLVTRAEVERAGARGWCMRLGDDRLATLAAAVLDAEVGARGGQADAVVALCLATERDHDAEAEREWRDLAPTEVRFDELD